MSIICDTNIWYQNAKDQIQLPENTELITPITVIEEIAITPNQDYSPDFIQEVIRKMMKRENSHQVTIINPVLPFHYLVSVNKKDNSYPVNPLAKDFLDYTERIAKCSSNLKELISLTKEYREERKKVYQYFSEEVNAMAQTIRDSVKDRAILKKHNNIEECKELIRRWTLDITKIKLTEDFDWTQIELFTSAMSVFFRRLALDKARMEANDTIDLINLMYVQPGNLYWTNDKKWLNMIKEAGMEGYLFSN